jgi:hypothetical protein
MTVVPATPTVYRPFLGGIRSPVVALFSLFVLGGYAGFTESRRRSEPAAEPAIALAVLPPPPEPR